MSRQARPLSFLRRNPLPPCLRGHTIPDSGQRHVLNYKKTGILSNLVRFSILPSMRLTDCASQTIFRSWHSNKMNMVRHQAEQYAQTSMVWLLHNSAIRLRYNSISSLTPPLRPYKVHYLKGFSLSVWSDFWQWQWLPSSLLCDISVSYTYPAKRDPSRSDANYSLPNRSVLLCCHTAWSCPDAHTVL